jgi:hypothetical protein
MPNHTADTHARSDQKDTYADCNKNAGSYTYAHIRNAGYPNTNPNTHSNHDEYQHVYPDAHID